MERNEWHKAQNERISRIASELVRLFEIDFRTQQSIEYEIAHANYLQALCNKNNYDTFSVPDDKDYHNVG